MTHPTHLPAPATKEEFNRAWYLSVNADVAAAGVDPWTHYLEYGHKEGRLGAPLRALELDHILWRGFAREAEAELRLLLRDSNAKERAAAGWVLARHAAAAGRWRNAASAIRRFHAAPASARVIAHPGPWLLGVQAATRSGDAEAARKVLGDARGRFPGDPNTALAALEVALVREEDDTAVSGCLAALQAGCGLVPLGIGRGARPRFDRLCAAQSPPPAAQGPQVSIAVPAHNAEKTLATCLRGLTRQSWHNLEIIVIDDCSTDRTAQIAEDASREDLRIRVIRHRENRGAYLARNTGFEAARGAFFTVHDADDWSHPQKIEVQVRPLLERADLQGTVSHWVRADSDLRMTLWRIEKAWIYRNVSSLMIRTGLRDRLGYWDRVSVNADTEYYLRLQAAYGPDAIAEIHPGIPLSFGRNEPGNLTLAKATHLSTQFAGARRRHLDAARDWHRRQIASLPEPSDPATRAAALHLAKEPGQRSYFASPEVGPSDPYHASDDYGRIATSPHFDAAWYVRRHADVLGEDVDPVRHYLDHGAAEDRDPGPLFPNAALRRLAELPSNATPLLAPVVEDVASLRPCFPGALQRREKPHVLVFAHSADLQVFGAERSLLTALERLASGYGGQEYAPVVVLPSAVNADYLEKVRARAVAVEILPQVWRHRFRPAPEPTVSAIRDLIRRYRPAEIHVNTIVLDTPLIAARLEGCPSVVHVRELPPQDPGLCRILGDSARGLRRRLLAEGDRFVANSQAVADWIGCPDRTVIWPNLVDPGLFDLPFAPAKGLRVALVSSNIAKKGIADFVAVARRVRGLEDAAGIGETRRCRFLLIGPASGDLASLDPLPNNVEHAGYAPDPVAAMQQCDVVLNLSHFAESFGRTALEAMSAGRPVVCYNRGTPPGFVTNGVTGFVTPPDDPDAVAEAVAALAVARYGLAKMSDAAREAARKIVADMSGKSGPQRRSEPSN
jgi:glycosyltransferase involved in cell wall biosynthesis